MSAMKTITNVCKSCNRVNVPDAEYLASMEMCEDCVSRRMDRVREFQNQSEPNINDRTNYRGWNTEIKRHVRKIGNVLLRSKFKFLWFGRKSIVCFVLPIAALMGFFVYWYAKGKPSMPGTGWEKALFSIVGIGIFLIVWEAHRQWKQALVAFAIAVIGLTILGDEVLVLIETMILALKNVLLFPVEILDME